MIIIMTVVVLTNVSPVSEAFAETEPYTLKEISHAFIIGDDYIHTTDEGYMYVSIFDLLAEPDLTSTDIRIILEWTMHIHNLLLLAQNNEDQDKIDEILEDAQNGSFSNLFDLENMVDPTISTNASFHTLADYDGLQACGMYIWEINDAIPNVTSIVYNSSTSNDEVVTKMTDDGYHQIIFGTGSLSGNDYGQMNYDGYGTCTDGQFRDQVFAYDSSVNSYTDGDGNVAAGWYAKQQLNEPNPEIFEYVLESPSIWWSVYVYHWHNLN